MCKKVIARIRPKRRIMSEKEYKEYEESLKRTKLEKFMEIMVYSFIVILICSILFWIKLDDPSRKIIIDFIVSKFYLLRGL